MRYAQLLNDVCIFCSLLFICYFAKYRFNPSFHFPSQFFVYFLRSITRTYYSISVCQCKINEEVHSLVGRSIFFRSFVKILLFLSFCLEASSKCVNRRNSLHCRFSISPEICIICQTARVSTPLSFSSFLSQFYFHSHFCFSQQSAAVLSTFNLSITFFSFCRCFHVVSSHLLVVSITVLPSLSALTNLVNNFSSFRLSNPRSTVQSEATCASPCLVSAFCLPFFFSLRLPQID